MAASDYSLNTNFSWKDIPNTSWSFTSPSGSIPNFANTFQAGNVPSFDWSKMPTSSYSWSSQPAPTTQPSREVDWGGLTKAVTSAVNLAKGWQSQSPRNFGDYEKTRSISGAAGGSGTERRLSPSLTLLEGERRMEQKQSARSGGNASGIGGAAGTLAGIGIAMIPGVGPGIAPFLPTLGSTVGQGIGSFFG